MVSTEIRDRRRTLRYRNLVLKRMIRMKSRISGLLMETGVSYNKQRLHKLGYFTDLLSTNEEINESIRPLLKVSREHIMRAQRLDYALVSSLERDPLLASAATVIASQALISGAFSLTRQAMLLGYLPRVTVKHTAFDTEGQIYIPEVNWLLAIGCILLVLTFRESVKLAAAYGIAVTGTLASRRFAITSLRGTRGARARGNLARFSRFSLVSTFRFWSRTSSNSLMADMFLC
jgi:hypothetical protein